MLKLISKYWPKTSVVLGALVLGVGTLVILQGHNPVRASQPGFSLPNDSAGSWLTVGAGGFDAGAMTILVHVPDAQSSVDITFNNLCDTDPVVDNDPANTNITLPDGSVVPDGNTGSNTIVTISGDTTGQSFGCGNEDGGGPINTLTLGSLPNPSIRDNSGVEVFYRTVQLNVLTSYIGSGEYRNSFRVSSSTPGVVLTTNANEQFGVARPSVARPIEYQFAPDCGTGTVGGVLELQNNTALSAGSIDWVVEASSRGANVFSSTVTGGTISSGDGSVVSTTLNLNQNLKYRLLISSTSPIDGMEVNLPFAQLNAIDSCSAVPLAPGPTVEPYFVADNGSVMVHGNIFARGSSGALGARSEHAAIINGNINGFGTDADYGEDALMFSNVGPGGSFGSSNLGLAQLAYDSVTATQAAGAPLPADVTSLGAGTTVYKYDASSLAHGGLFIRDDILIGPNYTINRPTDIRKLIVAVDGDIFIRRNVERLSGVFIATGDIKTCSWVDGTTPNLDQCDKRLTVRGSLIAGGNIILGRAAGGAGSAVDTSPSEYFENAVEMTVPIPVLNADGQRFDYTRELPVLFEG